MVSLAIQVLLVQEEIPVKKGLQECRVHQVYRVAMARGVLRDLSALEDFKYVA